MNSHHSFRTGRAGLLAAILSLGACDSIETSQSVTAEATARLEMQSTADVRTVANDAELLISFDEQSGQLPEGIAVDKTGNIFVSISPLGQLWKIAPRAMTPELFGTIDGIDPSAGDIGVLGLAVDAPGNVYAGVQSTNAEANGVWIFDRKSGEATRIPGTENVAFPNDVAFDKVGNMYITDSVLGAIWRLPKHGELEPWLVGDENLAGTGALGLGVPIGANGIEYRQGMLHVANTEKSLLLTIPINRDGSPGGSSILAEFPAVEVAPDTFVPGVPDGLALDVHGNIFVAQIALSTVARVTPDGVVNVVFSGDPLDWPSSIAFGTGKGYQQTLFAVNFSKGEGNGDTVPRMGPGLVAISAGVPGLPLP
jgi:sugar lactone lactonase YvrE